MPLDPAQRHQIEQDAITAAQPKQRAGTKQGMLIEMLRRPEGASIAEIVEATGWLGHSARGAISGVLKKKLALPVTAEKIEGRGTVYKLEIA